MIKRTLENIIKERLFENKIIMVLGPHQVGKTTLMKSICSQLNMPYLWLNGDEPDNRISLENSTSTKLKNIIGNNKVVIIDEAQRIENIGITLKLFADQLTDVQVLVTGSSSFDLTSQVNEPLTGRKYEYYLYPLSFKELTDNTSKIEEKRLLEHRLIYGCYPEIVTTSRKTELLGLLADSYLYKDILSYEKIRKHYIIEKLLQLLALQIGNEVNYHELGQQLGIDNQTVEKYISILEKAFVIFKLSSFSRNKRNEIKKGKKIYFYDIGIRNAIIKNFNVLSLRNDVGALWENYNIVEFIKHNHYQNILCNYYFWRTNTQKEIDLIEESGGVLHAYEFKWNPQKKVKIPKDFSNTYKDSEFYVITPEVYDEFLLNKCRD